MRGRVRAQRRKDNPLCGARTRSGLPCKAKAILGRARCKCHGGMSTGPRTEAGKAKVTNNLRPSGIPPQANP
ncbi:MAG: HGGxSTG domain-containing protein [Pseudoxanthomonas sp.]